MKPDLHPDIILLQKRLRFLVELEEYEIAATLKKWIDELNVYYSQPTNKNNKNTYEIHDYGNK